ncbi:motility associated factor glycosyltransferase family protein [Campylobacter lari]|uniref:motility associated factor glycosyltransferase family protein n=1 Tax=Campylobacter lari TaxID=201 RepID=UPI001BD91E31|nr:motility associated factor glycosyltransferase family protein [Campylobacter lari]MBT0826697.1 motility associated factor glycosyltransferase family protein [Campylobacter lari]
MNELFLKNTQALFEKDQPLALKLRELKECKQFELFQGSSDNLDINILDKKRKEFIYKDPIKELNENLNLFNGEYLRYPILFFYGLGNGILYKALLSNPIRNHLIIFEEELEIIYLVFHYLDLSEEIRSEKIILFYMPSITYAQLDVLMDYPTVKNYYMIYNLFTHSNFYNFYNINNLNENIIKAIKTNHTRHGNAPSDSLQGISQLSRNLIPLLTNPSLKDLLKQRKGKIKNAIVVSTGPSLIKQLPLLKEYANKASIICADSAYPILAKHNIKPDYVLMLERSELVSKCFDNDFKEFDKDILFVLASLVHKKTIEYLKRNNRKFMLIHRGLPFARAINLNDYGYIGGGMSVANMAYELAVKLGHKNIILIGQDLAYDENGNSHPKDYVHGKESENDRKQGLFITAYGGNGKVETNYWWKIFKDIFEKDIVLSKNTLNINTYNATEGGARIEGSIEKSFKDVCEDLLKEDKVLFELPTKNKTNINITNILEKKIQKISNILTETDMFYNNLILSLTHIKTQTIQELNFKEILTTNESLHILKAKIENMIELGEILNPALKNIELELAKISLMSAHTQEDKKIRMINWLLKHEIWIQEVSKFLKILLNILQKDRQ